MHIDTGLLDRIVLQRNRRDVSDAAFTGTCDVAGDLEARVRKDGKTVRGFNWIKVGNVQRRKLKGVLKGLPAGGPYDIELRVKGDDGGDELRIEGVLVGDVWIAAGQSNMQGCGWQPHSAKPHPMVRAFYMDDRWDTAKDPIHNMWACVDQVHDDLRGGVKGEPNKTTGVGPAVAFAQAMHAHTGVPQGVIASAHGGTSMTQWDPARKREGSRSLYGANVRRVKKNGGKVRGVIWCQGESDCNADAAPQYTDRMKKLVRAFRRDCNDAKLPIAVVQIGRVIAGWPHEHWNSVQDQQGKLARSIDHLTVVPTIDLALDDTIHIGGRDQQRLGKRLAYAMRHLLRRSDGKAPPTLRKVDVQTDKISGLANVVLTFDNVVGSLVAGSRPVGFAIGDPEARPLIFDTQLDGNRVTLRTTAGAGAMENKLVYYGHGIDPVCNITDEADRSLPVFGPEAIGERRALTPFVRALRVSVPVPAKGSIEKLPHPKDLDALKFKPRHFAQNMLDLHAEWKPGDPSTVRYFLVEFECSEPMKLALRLGYDGPVKAWIDGKAIFSDAAGTNPAVEDEAQAGFRAARGGHQLLVALDSNRGRAWGIFLRLERTDVTKRALEQGASAYAMPEFAG